MKKLIFVFVALLMVVLISGCGARQNTIRFDDASDEETMTTEASTEENTHETEEDMEDLVKNTTQPKGKLAVTSFDGAFLKTNLSYNVVRGTVPSSTKMIKVNDYKLQKYIPGQTEWSYIAARRFGTLNSGLNNYVIKTFDASGDQTGSIIFSINYEAPVIPDELPDVGASLWLTLLATLITMGSYAVFRKYKWL